MTTFVTTFSTIALSLYLSHVAAAPGGLPVDAASMASLGVPGLPSYLPWSLSSLVPPFPLAPHPPDDPVPPALVPAQKRAATPPPQRPARKKPWLAAAEVAGLNVAVWAFGHYVADEKYLYLSWETMRDNIRDGFEWDRSLYFVNFYNHPYHGYLYFNAGRANGLNYWGSALAALGGSLMWEMIMETNRPSINDLITTTAGGCVYGEMGYRFSALVRKKGARGLERIWRETVGTILDPIGGINRLLSGRKDSDPGLPGSPDSGRILNGEITLTSPVIARSTELTGTRAAPILGFVLNYGDPAGTDWSGQPFDVFSVNGRLRWGPDRPHLSLFIHGALLGKKLTSRNGTSQFLGLYQHYEYYGFDTLRVCGTSFTAGWSSRFAFHRGLELTTAVRLGWMGLGGSDDFYANPEDRRKYNLGTGYAAAAEAAIAVKGYEYFSAIWRHYGLYTLNIQGGRVGRESWDILQGQLSMSVLGKLGVGLGVEYCGRRFDFRDYPPGSRRLFEARAFATWQF